MALTTDYLYKFALKLMRSNQAGKLSATEFQFHWNDQSYAMFADLLGRFQARNNGKEGANTGLILNETILQKLSPFTKPLPIAVSAGNATKPSDFSYRLALRVNGKDCDKINHNQIANVNADTIDPPSIANGKCYFVEYQDYFYLLPRTGITTVDLDYVSIPKKIVWAYTVDADGRQQYNSSGITGLDIIYGGVGYTSPTITFSAPASGGVQALGTLLVSGGKITSVIMDNIGQGYAGLTPTFTITGASTVPAAFGSPIVSVQPQWGDVECLEITKRMFNNLGVTLKDKDFESFGQRVQLTGE